MREKRNPERELAEDVRRCAGLMEAVVERGRRLNLAPEAMAACVDLWRAWVRALDSRR
jgi:hypothetical protein